MEGLNTFTNSNIRKKELCALYLLGFLEFDCHMDFHLYELPLVIQDSAALG